MPVAAATSLRDMETELGHKTVAGTGGQSASDMSKKRSAPSRRSKDSGRRPKRAIVTS